MIIRPLAGSTLDMLAADPRHAPVAKMTRALYERTGAFEPWVSYVTLNGAEPVGVCSFKGPPENGAVEIAYYTFDPYEGRGIAGRMAAHLVEIAKGEPEITEVTAHTLPETNASTRILAKLGFVQEGEVKDPDAGTVWRWSLPVR